MVVAGTDSLSLSSKLIPLVSSVDTSKSIKRFFVGDPNISFDEVVVVDVVVVVEAGFEANISFTELLFFNGATDCTIPPTGDDLTDNLEYVSATSSVD